MRVHNFSAGPAALPVEVLEEAREELLDFKGSGASIMEQSHRGKVYGAVHEEALDNVRCLLNVPDDYAVLLLQGGATGQFGMVPMNFLGERQVADYVRSGSWASKAIQEAGVLGEVHLAADTSDTSPACMPGPDECTWSPGAAYAHLTSNETIDGIQWSLFPETKAPLVADMSSDILSRPLDVKRFGLIYAGAQKNLGPSGVTLVIIEKTLAEKGSESIPAIFRYKSHLEAKSLLHTPPTFAVYLVTLVTRWIIQLGGVSVMEERTRDKAKKLYDRIDASGFYTGTADPDHRSLMNVTFRLPSEELEDRFVKEAAQEDIVGIKGHHSVGGIRASIYNACPGEAVDALTGFMNDFEQSNG